MNFVKEVISSSFDVRDYIIKASQEIPDKYTCPLKVPVKDQGSKPTCVAHAAASMVEYHHKRQHGSYRAFSTEFIYGTRDIGYYVGDGMMIRDALRTTKKYGVPFKTECPGNNDVRDAINNINKNLEKYRELAYPHRVSAYYRCRTMDEIKTALIKHGPVLVSMKTYNGAKIVDDVYTYDTKADYGRHCVMVYGYDERGWLTQNSWGTDYAGDGRFVIPYDYKFTEVWGVTDEIVESDLCIKKRNKFTNFVYKLYNKIVNWWLSLTDKT